MGRASFGFQGNIISGVNVVIPLLTRRSGKVVLIFIVFFFTFITMVGGNPQHDAYGFRYWKTPVGISLLLIMITPSRVVF